MLVAGGLYREVCETPAWNREFGSGVRAAAVISKLSTGTRLYTYRSSKRGQAIDHLESLGIDVVCERRSTDIVFSYFHPLSNPLIVPAVVQAEVPLTVIGDSVLRFGFLEGTAIVSAERAVYDPQGTGAVEPFEANGSKAGELAIVLNEGELLRYSGGSDIETGCQTLLDQGRATVIVVKCGVRGALVVEPGRKSNIPPYWSARVFKIGTGDVFSAVFRTYLGRAEATRVDAGGNRLESGFFVLRRPRGALASFGGHCTGSYHGRRTHQSDLTWVR
jgi:hypothetical protein